MQNRFDNVKVSPQTKERHMSVFYGCVNFIDTLRFLTKSLEVLAKKVDNKGSIQLKKEIRNHWSQFTKMLEYPHDYFENEKDFKKPI